MGVAGKVVPRSLRARLTMLAALIAVLIFSTTAMLILILVPGNLQDVVQTRAELAARRVASPVRMGHVPKTIPQPLGDARRSYLMQVVRDDGRVVAASAGMRGRGPMVAFKPQGFESVATQELMVRRPGAERSEEHLVAAMRVRSPQGPLLVYAAVDMSELNRSVTLLNVVFFLGTPFAVLVVASVAWIAVGLTLRPVRRIRGQLEEISGRDLSRRVPVPGGADEIARLAKTTNDTLERLERSAEAQRRFVADASHELRSPITALRCRLDVNAEEHPEDVDWPRENERTLEEAARLSAIVDELLMLARLDAGATADRRIVDIGRLTADQIRRFERGRVTVRGGPTDRAPVLGSPVQLDRLLTNLLDNAVRHARERVDVRVGVDGDEVVVTVVDDGPGIAPEDRERVFERFTRLREGRRLDKGGSGLGLPLSREIATAHGGSLQVTDDPGGGPGAAFVLRLPRVLDGEARGEGPPRRP